MTTSPVEQNNAEAEEFVTEWRATHDFDFIPSSTIVTMFQMLAAAINKAGSTDALKVALALEGMKVNDLIGVTENTCARRITSC